MSGGEPVVDAVNGATQLLTNNETNWLPRGIALWPNSPLGSTSIMSMDVERVVGELNDRLRFSHGRLQESKLELVNIKTEAARKLRNAEVNVQTLKGELKFITEEFGQRVVDIQGLQNELKQRNINENQQREKMAEKDALIQTLRQQAAERDAHVSALTQYATWLRDEVQRRGESVCEHGEHVKRLTCQATKNDLEVNGLRERMAHRSKIEEEKRKLLEGKLEDAHKKIVGLKEQKSCLQSTCQEKHEILVAENDRLRQKVSDLQFRLASRPLSRLPRQTTRVPLCVVEEKIDSVLEDCGKTCYLEAEHDEVVKRARKESKNVDVFYGKHVPAVVVQAFQEMVDQPDGRISIEDIDTTILAVDLIYQRSMRKKTAELRAKHMQEMGEVHQKIKERAPYTQIICADKVRYLKKQLTDAQKRRGPMHGDGAKMMKVLLDKAFCMAVEYDRQATGTPSKSRLNSWFEV
ncbi:hypothetical protein BSKO_03303 [Bryopsis sp. KO-2023]|nr:hypothetical protein BSKO_03303 [Bryopsis sp. KO-2023]